MPIQPGVKSSCRAVRVLVPTVVALVVAGGTAVALEPKWINETRVQVGGTTESAAAPLPAAPTPETAEPTVPAPTTPAGTPAVPSLLNVPHVPSVPAVPAVTVPRVPIPTTTPPSRPARLEANRNYIADADGSGLVLIDTDLDFAAARLSPDGSRLAFLRNDRVWVANADGSEASPISGDERACCHLDWSPDGRDIAYEVSPRSAPRLRILAVSPDGRASRVLVDDGAQPVWSPAGGRLMFMGGAPELWLSVRQADGTVQRILRGMQNRPAWSPDGRQLLVSGTDHETGREGTWVVEADGSGRRRIDAAGDYARQALTWSPDGAYITWGVGRPGPGEVPRTWIARPDGSGVREIGATFVSPVWVPPGHKLLVPDGGRADIMNADGSGRRPFLNNSDTSVSYGVVHFSANGRRVVIGTW